MIQSSWETQQEQLQSGKRKSHKESKAVESEEVDNTFKEIIFKNNNAANVQSLSYYKVVYPFFETVLKSCKKRGKYLYSSFQLITSRHIFVENDS